jgi:hypothetical protein
VRIPAGTSARSEAHPAPPQKQQAAAIMQTHDEAHTYGTRPNVERGIGLVVGRMAHLRAPKQSRASRHELSGAASELA